MKLITRGLALVVALVCLTGVNTVAHHSIAAKFDETKTQTLSGIVTLVDWRNRARPARSARLDAQRARREERVGELGD